MARIRSVKPQLRTSLTVAAWPREVRYAWVLLWGYLDDHGRGKDDLRLVVADLFPLDRDITERKLDRWLDLMCQPGPDDDVPPLCRYEVDGRRYLHAVKWSGSTGHQKISHPTDSRIPPCPHHPPSGITPESLRNASGITPEEPQPSSGITPELFQNDSGSHVRATRAEQGAGRREKGEGGAKRATKAPDHLLVTAEMKAWALSAGVSADLERETAAMLDHHRSKGTTFKDWHAAWRNWMRNSVKFDSRRPAAPTGTDPDSGRRWEQ